MTVSTDQQLCYCHCDRETLSDTALMSACSHAGGSGAPCLSFCLNHDVFVPSESVMSTQGFTAALLDADEDSNLMFHLSELLMSVNTRVSSLGSSGQKHLSVFGCSLILTDRKCVIHELHFCEEVSCCVSCLWTNTSVPAEDLVPSTCPYRTSRCLQLCKCSCRSFHVLLCICAVCSLSWEM